MERNSAVGDNPTNPIHNSNPGQTISMTEVKESTSGQEHVEKDLQPLKQQVPYKLPRIVGVTFKIQPPREKLEEQAKNADDDAPTTSGGNARGPLLKQLLVEPDPNLVNEGPSNPVPINSPGDMANNKAKLERMESSADLQSRLKSRKTLGVGENPSNGQIPRSKTEQMLGYNEHLHMKLPKGYWKWHKFLVVFLAFQGTFILACPHQASQYGLVGVDLPEKPVPSQYYGVTMLALASFLWQVSEIMDKRIIRAALLSTMIYFSGICCVDIMYAFTHGIHHLFDRKGIISMGIRTGILLVSTFYLHRIGSPTAGIRKSPSHKEDKNQNVSRTTAKQQKK